MTKIYVNWENNNFTWNTEIRLWEEVYDIIEELVGGVRNPEEWGDMPYQQQEQLNNSLKEQLEQNLKKLSEEKKNKLIEVMITIGEEKFNKKLTISDKKDIKITVNDIKIISENYLNIEVKYLN